jgi:hypothetical protein
MNNNSENMVSRFLTDLVKFTAHLLIMCAVSLIVGFLLFAPAFAPYFTGRICGQMGCSDNDPRVRARMFPFKVMLWIICITSWSIILMTQISINTNISNCAP